MNTKDGTIIAPDELEKILALMPEHERQHIKQMNLDPTPRQKKRMKIGRNDPCPCGSGKKFKKCCLK